MESKELPISLEFFKQYSYYEEVIDVILKESSHNNSELYEQLRKDSRKCENAIRNYYTAFYLRPKIRKKLPLRLKPMPQKMKDKFLCIPNKNALKYDINGEKLSKRKDKREKKMEEPTSGLIVDNDEVNRNRNSEMNLNPVQDKNPISERNDDAHEEEEAAEILAIDDDKSNY